MIHSHVTIADLKEGGARSLVSRLKAALRADGDFPVRAKVVAELRSLANNPNSSISQITDVILREPSLGTRILHMVNSAFYQRAAPVLTISQAVIQLGMRTLSDMCAGLVLMHKFIPAAKRGGIFADGVKCTILTSLLASLLASKKHDEGISERGYLAGTLYNIGALLLAYYFPQVYEAAGKRALARAQPIRQSITELLGTSPLELNIIIIEALDIPVYYRDVLAESAKPLSERTEVGPNTALANALTAAGEIAEVITAESEKVELLSLLAELSITTGFSEAQFMAALRELPAQFREHCQMIELNFLTLPSYILEFQDTEETNGKVS